MPIYEGKLRAANVKVALVAIEVLDPDQDVTLWTDAHGVYVAFPTREATKCYYLPEGEDQVAVSTRKPEGLKVVKLKAAKLIELLTAEKGELIRVSLDVETLQISAVACSENGSARVFVAHSLRNAKVELAPVVPAA